VFEIRHHGAVNGVTGSCHELVLDANNSLLIDCGLFQGAETSGAGASFEHLQIEFPIEKIRALLVTHCHIDHVGRIPYLFAAGFNGPIFCSKPSAYLLPKVLEDAIKVGFTRNQALVQKTVNALSSKIIGVDYNVLVDLTDLIEGGENSAQVSFSPAGHILGSAYISIDTEIKGDSRRLVFSGDLGAPDTPLLPDPTSPASADILVIESTYGDSIHPDRRARTQQLKSVVERCLLNSGVILVPAFSIGRTQELLYELEQIIHQHGDKKAADGLLWQDIEIIVDSPLAAQFTESYRELKEYWDTEAKQRVEQGRHPLAFEQLYCVDTHQEHMQTVEYLSRKHKPAIVIAASGMCAGGRIVNYLKALIGDERTDIVFVGYQAAGTPGRDIQRYAPANGYVMLDDQRYDIKAAVHTLSGYSAHADQQNLIDFVMGMQNRPQEIRIVHGDTQAKKTLQSKLQDLLPDSRVVVPTE